MDAETAKTDGSCKSILCGHGCGRLPTMQLLQQRPWKGDVHDAKMAAT